MAVAVPLQHTIAVRIETNERNIVYKRSCAPGLPLGLGLHFRELGAQNALLEARRRDAAIACGALAEPAAGDAARVADGGVARGPPCADGPRAVSR